MQDRLCSEISHIYEQLVMLSNQALTSGHYTDATENSTDLDLQTETSPQ